MLNRDKIIITSGHLAVPGEGIKEIRLNGVLTVNASGEFPADGVGMVEAEKLEAKYSEDIKDAIMKEIYWKFQKQVKDIRMRVAIGCTPASVMKALDELDEEMTLESGCH